MLLAQEDGPPWWTAALAALGLGIAGTVAVFFSGLQKVVKAMFARREAQISAARRAGRDKHVASVELMVQAFEGIEGLVRMEDCVDRVLLMTGTNGGGVPSVNTPYKVACLFARCSDPKKNPGQLYAGPLRVDAAYMRMIRDVIRQGVISLTRTEMAEGDMLRGYYDAEGVHSSRIYFLSLVPERLTFCSVASYTRPFTAGEVARIDAAMNRLRGIMDTDTGLEHKALLPDSGVHPTPGK